MALTDIVSATIQAVESDTLTNAMTEGMETIKEQMEALAFDMPKTPAIDPAIQMKLDINDAFVKKLSEDLQKIAPPEEENPQLLGDGWYKAEVTGYNNTYNICRKKTAEEMAEEVKKKGTSDVVVSFVNICNMVHGAERADRIAAALNAAANLPTSLLLKFDHIVTATGEALDADGHDLRRFMVWHLAEALRLCGEIAIAEAIAMKTTEYAEANWNHAYEKGLSEGKLKAELQFHQEDGSLLKQAYDSGVKAGIEQTKESVYKIGHQDGYKAGVEEANLYHAEDKQYGWENGYQKGYLTGYVAARDIVASYYLTPTAPHFLEQILKQLQHYLEKAENKFKFGDSSPIPPVPSLPKNY